MVSQGASSGRREDVATYLPYAGKLRGVDAPPGEWLGWDQPSTRGWFAFVRWQALDSYWRAVSRSGV